MEGLQVGEWGGTVDVRLSLGSAKMTNIEILRERAPWRRCGVDAWIRCRYERRDSGVGGSKRGGGENNDDMK